MTFTNTAHVERRVAQRNNLTPGRPFVPQNHRPLCQIQGSSPCRSTLMRALTALQSPERCNLNAGRGGSRQSLLNQIAICGFNESFETGAKPECKWNNGQRIPCLSSASSASTRVNFRPAACAATDSLVVYRAGARAHWKLRSATWSIRQVSVEQIQATGDVSVDPAGASAWLALTTRASCLIQPP